MKNLFLLLLFSIIASTQAQTLTLADVQEKAFEYHDGTCLHKLLLTAEGTFYSIHTCGAIETITSGTYDIKKKSLELWFDGVQVTKTYNKPQPKDTVQPYNNYSEEFPPRSKTVYNAVYTNKQWLFSTGRHMLAPSKKGYDAVLKLLEIDNTILRLALMKDGLINPFAGVEGFSTKNDSLIIARYIDKLNADFTEIDEEGRADYMNSRYNDGYATYAPDNSFKIFVMEGEGCGGNCSGMYYAVIQYASGKVQQDVAFSKIMSLTQNPQTKVAGIIDYNWGGGYAGGYSLNLSLFTTAGDSLTFKPVFTDYEALPVPLRSMSDQDGGLSINKRSWAGDTDFDLQYDAVSGKVSYTYPYGAMYGEDFKDYIPENVRPNNDNEAVQVTGSFILKNGAVTNFKEGYKKVPLGF
jgi:hypothetical protein